MGIGSCFYRTSKRLSRVHLYEWMEREMGSMTTGEQPLRCLNVGAGGDIYQRIRKLTRAEIVQIDIDAARKPDIVASVCSMPMFADASFDAVFMMEVLEHVTEPQQALSEIRRILKPGGRLILSVPFIFPLHDEPHDYYRYTKYGLAYMLRNFGNVRIRERNATLDAILVLQARLIITGDRKQRLAGAAVFLSGLLCYPFMRPLTALCVPDKATTGYFVTASRP